MALIKCTECGQMISDKAERCPKCGCPISSQATTPDSTDSYEDEIEKPRKSKKLWLTTLILMLLVAVGAGAWVYYNGTNGADAIVKITPEFSKKVRQYDDLEAFHEGMAAVSKGDKWGYIDVNGDEMIPCQYIAVGRCSDGLISVLKDEDGLIAFISAKNGKEVEELSNKYYISFGAHGINNGVMPDFHNGICRDLYAMSQSSKDWDCEEIAIDLNGKRVNIDAIPQNDGVSRYSDTLYIDNDNIAYVKFSEQDDNENSLYGVKTQKGTIVIPAKYSYVGDYSNGVFYATLVAGEQFDDEYKICHGYIDLNGNETFKAEDYKTIKEANNAISTRKYEEERRQREEEKAKSIDNIKSWIQGRWEATINLNGTNCRCVLVIDGNNMAYSMNGSLTYNGSYEISTQSDPMIVYNNNYDILALDVANQRIQAYENQYFQKTSSSSGHISNSSSHSPYEAYDNIVTKINTYLSELRRLENAPQVDPNMMMRAQYLKQNILQQYDDLMSLARRNGDQSLYTKYYNKKQQMIQIFHSLRY